MTDRLVSRVAAFGGPEVVRLAREPLGPVGRGRVRVRVTHASLGSTDLVARRGGYLLQPRPGFTPGYDLVGVLLSTTAEAARLGLREGMLVAGCLPRMGAHATVVDVAPSLLVPLPDGLDPAVAAALPLDLVTARRAVDLLDLPERGSSLIQGVTGPVGALAAQHAARLGARVYGTASARTRGLAEARGVRVLDYGERDWPAQLLTLQPGGVDGSIDHTGGDAVRRVTAREGRVVRTAFAGRAGHERRDTALRGTRTLMRFRGHPAERLCSVPQYLVSNRAAYRRMLAAELALVAAGELVPPTVRTAPFAEIEAAHRAAARAAPGEKVVLAMEGGGS